MKSAKAIVDLMSFFVQMVKKVLQAMEGLANTYDARSLEAYVEARGKAMALGRTRRRKHLGVTLPVSQRALGFSWGADWGGVACTIGLRTLPAAPRHSALVTCRRLQYNDGRHGGDVPWREGEHMKSLLKRLVGHRGARGLSRTATLIIAVLILLVGWRLIMPLVFAVVGILKLIIDIGLLIVIVLLIAWLVKVLTKKV